MGAQTPEQRIVALIKAAAGEVAVQPEAKQPSVVVYGSGSVVAAGDVHIHHHHYPSANGAQTAPTSAQT